MVNLGNMMKQAQQLQKKMSEAQEKLNSIEVEGVSGGGMVKVVATAKGEVKRITLIDKNKKVVSIAKNRLFGHYKNVDFITSDVFHSDRKGRIQKE